MRTIESLVLAVLFALGTALVGWWAVPVVALVAGTRERSGGVRPLLVALAAALAWAVLLAVDATTPALRTLLRELGGIMSLPPAAIVVVTLVFPALLAWSAAALGGALFAPGNAGTRAPSRGVSADAAAGVARAREEPALRR